MSIWHLTFQGDALPIAISRDDGPPEAPPPGLIRYVELAYGQWTLDAATVPLGTEFVEWPRLCVWREVNGCSGTMHYVHEVRRPVMLEATGESTHPAGWQCDTCGGEEVGGFSVLMRDWEDEGPA